MFVPYGEFTPDLPVRDNQGATVAKNVIPAINSYKQFLGLSEVTDAIDAYPRGYISLRDATGSVKTFVGNETKLYQLTASAWIDESKSGGYALSTEQRWEFDKFGEQVIAVSIDAPIQEYTIGTSTEFADLSADAPKARHIAVIRDFIVVGSVDDAVDGEVPYRVQWPDIGTTTDWVITGATQADYQDLNGNNGGIIKIVGGEYGTIFQERAITRMSYAGAGTIFQFDEVESERGAICSGSVVKSGNIIFYLSDNGFYAFNGAQSIPIGDGKIDRFFFSDVAEEYLHRMSAVADPVNKLILWSYAGANNNAGVPNKILAYNYSPLATKRWTYIEVECEMLGRFLSGGYNVDSGVVTDIDAAPWASISLDSRYWTGFAPDLSAFSSDRKLGVFNGAALEATIETGEFGGTERQLLQDFRPDVDEVGTSVSVQIGTRDTQSAAVTWGSALAANAAGNFPCLSNARYHRIRTTITGGFKDARGIDIIKTKSAGYR